MTAAGAVLRTAAPEFAVYEEALARNSFAVGIDPATITVGTRLDMVSLMRAVVRGSGIAGILLLVSGLASVWFWSPAQSLIGAGAAMLTAAGNVETYAPVCGRESRVGSR